MSDIATRLEPIRVLSEEYGQSLDYERLFDQELNAYDFRKIYGVLPTIGCEVEVKWSSLFPTLAEEFFGEQDKYGRFKISYNDLSEDRKSQLDKICLELDLDLKPRFNRTCEAGIPAGKDAYWEFANSPAYSYRTLAAEIDLLKNEGLIPEGGDHSLHVTLGDLSIKGGGVSLILCSLELMYANPSRIEAATIANKYGGKNTWARRGKDGIRPRHINDLKLDSMCASELRTLSLYENVSPSEILETSQIFGASLLAYRNKDQIDESIIELSNLWSMVRLISREAIKSAGLPIKSWGLPHRNKEKWLNWAEFISSRDNSNSEASDLILSLKEIQKEAKAIIDL